MQRKPTDKGEKGFLYFNTILYPYGMHLREKNVSPTALSTTWESMIHWGNYELEVKYKTKNMQCTCGLCCIKLESLPHYGVLKTTVYHLPAEGLL